MSILYALLVLLVTMLATTITSLYDITIFIHLTKFKLYHYDYVEGKVPFPTSALINTFS